MDEKVRKQSGNGCVRDRAGVNLQCNHREEEVKSKLLSRVRLFAIPQTLQSMKFSRPEYECVAFLFSRGSSQPRDQTQVSLIAGRFFSS